MDKDKSKKLQRQCKQPKTPAAKVKKLIKKNKARMLSIAVAITVGSSLTACSPPNNDSYYRQGTYGNAPPSSSSSQGSKGQTTGYGSGSHYYGSYYYGRGSTFKNGSWGTADQSIGHSTGTGTGGGTYGIGG